MAKVDASGGIRAMELWLLPFAAMFTRPSWLNAVALTSGALLCLNRRTVCAALRAVDGAADKGFSRFHRFLSCAQWSGLQGAKILLGLLQKAFVPDDEPLVIAVDDSVERRRGARIRDKGIWRDAVRSSRGVFVKTEGLRWLSLQVVVRPGFARRTWGLPFLTILSRSEQVDTRRQRRHQTLPEKAAWAMRLVARWCPGRRLVMVADGAYASLDVFWALRERAVCVARCRLDARFFNPPPPRKKGRKGRPRVRGTRQLTPRTRAVRKATKWVRMTIPGWRTKDGRTERAVDVATGTALWSAHGKTMPVRWVLTRDPTGRAETRVFVCSDPAQSALQILTWYARRWAVEIVFTQLTKADVLALGGDGQHIADFDVSVGDDHAIDEQHQELTAPLEVSFGQPPLHSRAEGLQRGRHAGELLLARRVVTQQRLLPGQCLHAPLQIAAPPLILIERDDRSKVGVGEPLDLLAQMRLAAAQRFAAREQLLGQPRSSMGTGDRRCEWCWLVQQRAQILPYQLIELFGGDITRRAARRPMRVRALSLAIA